MSKINSFNRTTRTKAIKQLVHYLQNIQKETVDISMRKEGFEKLTFRRYRKADENCE